jgi:hypothetical protein
MANRIRERVLRGCALCGGCEIERDEVLDAGVLGLAECTRCHHRWTERPLRHALFFEAAERVVAA